MFTVRPVDRTRTERRSVSGSKFMSCTPQRSPVVSLRRNVEPSERWGVHELSLKGLDDNPVARL